MQKDIIYIDTEDDITAIIGKIKDTKEKIIALVPPRRIGVLQSAVNLQLLARTARDSKKRLVIITNNKALMTLSSAAKIPTAKNLQSKPELAEINALEVDDGEDIIDGSQLPVGDLAKMATKDTNNGTEDIVKVMHNINVDEESYQTLEAEDEEPKTQKKSSVKVPNFTDFRKKLFIGIFAGAALIIFFIWAIFFAPAAKVIITAKTEPAPVSLALKLVGPNATDLTKSTIQSLTKTAEKDLTVDFTATGKEMIGKKATGTMTLSNAAESNSIPVPAGTVFSNGNYAFATDTSTNVPGASLSGGTIIASSVDVAVTAVEIGADYNLNARSYSSPVAGVTAYGSNMSGGESHEAIVVTADDIQKAKEKLSDLSNKDTLAQLKEQFANGEIVIEESFDANYGEIKTTPELGKEATSGKAVLTSKTKFSLTAVAKSELETYLKDAVEKQIKDSEKQRIYDNGIDDVVMSGFDKSDSGMVINVATTGKIGPNIDQVDIKNQVKGKHYGDAQSILEGTNGVVNVDVKFSYFWVRTIPNNIKKITIEFVLEDA